MEQAQTQKRNLIRDLIWAEQPVWRSFDFSHLNNILNHPEVLPWVAQDGQTSLDATEIVLNPDNHYLEAEGGSFLFVKLAHGLYELHTQFVPGHDRFRFKQAADAAARYMFCRTDCVEGVTKVPEDNETARKVAEKFGFSHWFTRRKAWAKGGKQIPVDFYLYRLQEWITQSAYMQAVGQQFHAMLEALGHTPEHEDDKAHDAQVGAAALMVLSGQPEKAAFFYNRWAVFAGYEQMNVLELDPLVIDIGDAVLRIEGEKIVLVEA